MRTALQRRPMAVAQPAPPPPPPPPTHTAPTHTASTHTAATPPPSILAARAILSLVILIIVALLFYVQAFYNVLLTRPLLHPVALLLLFMSLWSLYAIYTPETLRRYDQLANPHLRCSKCLLPRPPRAHHCSQCRRCFPRMSHHCGVLGVCLAAHNYKPFVLLIFYGFISCLLQTIFTAPPAIQAASDLFARKIPFSLPLIFWFQITYAQFSFTLVTLLLLAFHLRVVSAGYVPLDLYTTASISDLLPYAKSRSPYDRGPSGNFREVFGSGFRVFLPIVDVHAILVHPPYNPANM